MTGKTYKSEALAALHETMADLHQVGAIDKQTMHRFDESCLTQIHEFSAESIRAFQKLHRKIGLFYSR